MGASLPLRDPGLVVATIARALELGEEPGSPVDTVARALAGKRSLLLVDNLEHLLPDAAVLVGARGRVLRTLRLLVTSRERLASRASTSIRSGRSGRTTPSTCWSREPVALGRPISSRRGGDGARRRLDRLPLAIELAAARLKLLGPAELLERLEGVSTRSGEAVTSIHVSRRSARRSPGLTTC